MAFPTPDDAIARQAELDATSDVDLLTKSRQVLIDDRDELAFGQFIDQATSADDKPCHCLAGAALQACDLYIPDDNRNMPGGIVWLTIPTVYNHVEIAVMKRLAPLLEPAFDETLIRAAMAKREVQAHGFADVDETVTWDDLLDPAASDRAGMTPGALVFTYNDYVLHPLGKAEAKAEAIKLYDRAITALEGANA